MLCLLCYDIQNPYVAVLDYISLCMYSVSDWSQCWDVGTFLLLQLSSCGFVLFIFCISLTSVHLLFLQWRLGGIFECLMFTVCIAGLCCLHLQVHLYLMLLKGRGGVLTLVCICCKTTNEWGLDRFFFSLVTMTHDDGSDCECIVILVQDEGLSANAGGGRRSVP